ncbi:MAG: UbiA family prenyltransferase [Deltaproteobacteria bacterium]|nr:UbiA family prenyltransferase [Deltaproteobacteria bacterium]
MVPCTVKKALHLIPKEGTRIKSGLQRFGLHLRNMRLIGGDTVITAALLPLLGFFLLHGLKDVPWLTIVGLLLVGLLLTATIFGLNNVTDVKIDACDPLKQTNGINPIALGQLKQREAMIPLLGCSLLALGLAAWLSVLPWAFLALTVGALYSLPPVRLKERAGLDLLAHSLLPLSILLMGMAAAHANHPLRAAVGAAWVCLISAKSDTTNLIRDYDSDRGHNIRTTAVCLGIRAVWWLRLGLVLAAAGLLRCRTSPLCQLVGGFQPPPRFAGSGHRCSGDSGDLSTRLLLAKTAIAVKAELYCRWRPLCSVEWLGQL